MNRQQDQLKEEFLAYCSKLNVDPKSLEVLTFEKFQAINQPYYNMNEEAWRTLWEADCDKKFDAISKFTYSVENEEQLHIDEKRVQYMSLMQCLMGSKVIENEKSKLEKLKAGQLKDFRCYIETVIADLTNSQKHHVPRYKKVELTKGNSISSRNFLGKPPKETIVQLTQDVNQVRKRGQSFTFVGLDKLQPQILKEQQFEIDVKHYIPISQRHEKKAIQKIQVENRNKQVYEKNQRLQEEKLRMLMNKQQTEEQRLIEQVKLKQRVLSQRQVEHLLVQQDKQENQKRLQIIKEYNTSKLRSDIKNKQYKLERFAEQKQKLNLEKLQISKQIQDFQQYLENQVTMVQFGKLDPNHVLKSIQHYHPNIVQQQHESAKQVHTQHFERPPQNISLKLQKELQKMEHKHNMEMRVLIEREQLAENNRLELLNKNQCSELLELFSKQRKAAFQRIQDNLTRQSKDVHTLIKLYKK